MGWVVLPVAGEMAGHCARLGLAWLGRSVQADARNRFSMFGVISSTFLRRNFMVWVVLRVAGEMRVPLLGRSIFSIQFTER
jgi:hypothetical protein